MKFKTEWDFSQFYAGITDPKVERDVQACIKLYTQFAKKYKDKKFLKNATTLAAALNDVEKLHEKADWRGLQYLALQQTIDSSNAKLQAEYTRLEHLATEALKEITFFNLSISKIEAAKQKKLLKDKKLAQYAYALKLLFDEGKHTVSEAEEKILTDKASVAHEAWVTMQDKYENAQMVKHEGKDMSLSEAMSIKNDLPRPERRALHNTCIQKYKEISFVAEGELNAIIRNKMMDDKLRKYTQPYEATVKGYQNDLKSVENLIDVVTASNHIAHGFFELKAKIINKIDKSTDKKITIAELGTSVSTASTAGRSIPIDEAVSMVKEAFNEAGTEYGDFLDAYLAKGQIDAFPRKGKQGGAFCAGSHAMPTYVLLNYANKLNDISTIAHEMGHAIHTDFSKTQPILYQDYTISVAEVASTFFENILFDKLLGKANEAEKFDLLINNVQDRILTIHAQIAYFQFEKKLHAAVKEKGFVSKEEIAEMFTNCRRSYVGPAMDVNTDDGYAFVYISHFRSFFYVYAYAYGQLIADAMYAEYKKDKRFIDKVKKFLSAGSSMSPVAIFKSIGIDTTKPDFFKKGLKKLDDDLEKVKRMAQ